MILDYEEKILKKLVESYRNSKKDTGTNVVNRRTKIKPEVLYKKYHENNGDYDKISAINQAVSNLQEKGYVSAEFENFSTELISIYLSDGIIDEIEKYLIDKYGFEPKDNKINTIKDIISEYENASDICAAECNILRESIDKRQIPKNIDDIEDVLEAIAFIENNKTRLYIREASMIIYGDSKFFENKTLGTVCKIIRKYEGSESAETEIEDEILEKFNIFKEPQKISVKGKMIILIDGVEVDLSGFKNGVEFSADDLDKIETIKINVPSFMTVENRTAYLRCNEKDKVVFYLGGYANRNQRDFIKKVYKDNPDINYEHFGDIDAGGFWIHHNLCEITGIRFELYSMSINELANPEYASCVHNLTDNDIQRLQSLSEIPEYAEVVKYMLDNNVKLEQEIVSLRINFHSI